MITLSIIVPVYNVEKYLEKCIDSILKQTFKDYELILIDDGSTDSSGLICDHYVEKDSRIKVIHQRNKGLSCARNIGIDIARGEYIGFVDSDDWIEADMYETLLENIKKSCADIAVCGKNEVYESGQIKQGIRNNSDTELDKIQALSRLFNKNDNIYACAWNKIYKKKVFSNIRYPEGKTYEDVYVIIDILFNAEKIHVTEKALYNYLRRGNSITGEGCKQSKWDSVFAAKKAYENMAAHYPQYTENVHRYYCEKSILALESLVLSNTNDSLSQKKLQKMIVEELPFIMKDKVFTIKRKISIVCLAVNYRLFKLCVKIKYSNVSC